MKRDRLKDLAEAAVDRWLSNRETWMKTIIANVAKTLAPIVAEQVKAELVGMIEEDTDNERAERYGAALLAVKTTLMEPLDHDDISKLYALEWSVNHINETLGLDERIHFNHDNIPGRVDPGDVDPRPEDYPEVPH